MAKEWCTLHLSLSKAKALRDQLGDVPKRFAGPEVLALYQNLDERLRLIGSHDDPAPRLKVVR